MFWAKLRPNALIMGILCSVMVIIFGWKLFGVIEGVIHGQHVNEATIALILALAGLVFTPLGALIAFSVQLATDPEPNPIIEYIKAKMSGKVD